MSKGLDNKTNHLKLFDKKLFVTLENLKINGIDMQKNPQNNAIQKVETSKQKCVTCGITHDFKSSAAIFPNGNYAAMSPKLKKTGNYAPNRLPIVPEGDENENTKEDAFAGAVRMVNVHGKPKWIVEFSVKNSILICQIDTGAEANIISIESYLELDLHPSKIVTSKTVIVGLGGATVKLIGKAVIPVHLNGIQRMITFYVLLDRTRTILGLRASVKLQLITINKKFLSNN